MQIDDDTRRLVDQINDSVEKCWNCNFCYSKCPLNLSTVGFMKYGPSGLTQGAYYALKWGLADQEQEREELLNMLYACTTCNDCVLTCKQNSAGIPILEIIENARGLLTENNIGPLPSQRTVLKAMSLKGNPYNYAPEDRFNWLTDTQVKFFPEKQAEVLYYAGCTPSYDNDLHQILQNIVKIMQAAGVDFALHRDESCCGCSAKVLGDEYLFRNFVDKNSKNFAESGVRAVVTSSPHCYNTYKNEYGLAGDMEIVHYTQLLARELKNLKLEKELDYVVTYHDPCYLSKHNGVCAEPRELIKSVKGIKFVEMEDHGEDSLCCGGGGGRMWAEVEEESPIGETRVRQALAVGANILLTACPWCYTMLRDATKNLDCQDKIKVMDITELLYEALNREGRQ